MAMPQRIESAIPELRIAEPSRAAAEASARLMEKRALEVGPPLLCGDPDALRSPGPLVVKNAAWSREEAAAGDELDLSAEIDGTDASGITFHVRDASGLASFTLAARVAGTQARAKWRVVPSEMSGEQWDFFVFKGEQYLGCSNRLFVTDVIHAQLIDEESREPLAHQHYEITLADETLRAGKTDESGFLFEGRVPPGRYTVSLVEAPQPRLKLVEGTAPALKRHVHVGRVRAIPARALEGDTVKLRAFILGANDGDRVAFRVFRGAAEEPCAVLEGRVAGETATAEWRVVGVEGCESFVDFDLEAECGADGARRHCFCELRGYPRPDGAAVGAGDRPLAL